MEFLKERERLVSVRMYVILTWLGDVGRKIFCQNKKKMYFCKLK